MEHIYAFIYAKDGEIKVLSLQEATRDREELESGGWKHTHTLNPNVYIQYLHNECDNKMLIDEIKALAEHTKH